MDNTRIPPQDIDSEMALLGSMMVANTESSECSWTMEEITSVVSAESFYIPAHQRLFGVLVDLRSDPTRKCDLLIVSDELRSRNLFEAVGGQDYLIQLASSFADWTNAKYYAEIVRRMQIKRAIIKLAVDISQRGFDPLEEPADILADIAKQVDRLNRACVIDRVPEREADLIRAVKHPDEYADEGVTVRVPMALGNLGYLLNGGLALGTLTVVGALSSCGKTSLAITLAHHVATAVNGSNVLFVSAEMLSREVAIRFIAVRTGMSVSGMESGEVLYDQFYRERDRAAVESERGRQIYILDDIDDLEVIIAQVKNAVRKYDVRMIVIDYLTLLNISGRHETNDLKIGAITRSLKKMARSEKIAIVLPSQFSRGVAKEDRKPVMSDLRGSGNIEQDADNILLIWATGKKDPGNMVAVKVIVAKQRQGATGLADLYYNKTTMSFVTGMIEPAMQTAQMEFDANVDDGVPF